MNLFDFIRKRDQKIGTYRMITTYTPNGNKMFIVEVCGIISWHTIKVFVSNDADYARNCAQELLDTLNEKID